VLIGNKLYDGHKNFCTCGASSEGDFGSVSGRNKETPRLLISGQEIVKQELWPLIPNEPHLKSSKPSSVAFIATWCIMVGKEEGLES